MEILNCIGGTIGGYVVGSIKRRYGYLKHYKNNIIDLTRQVESLKEMEDDMNEAIEVAKRNGEVILRVVQQWIASIEGVKVDAIKFLGGDVKAEMRCFKGWFPNMKMRYRLSREAMKKLQAIQKLLEEGATFVDEVSRPPPPPGIDFLPSKHIVLFQTTMFAMEKVMDALKDDCTHFVGIYGMGGVGKTTLVKEIGKKCKEDGLFDDVAMAVVSHTVDVARIQEQIAEFLGLKLEEETEMIRANRLRNRLKSEEKILVILDDLWSNVDLTTIGIPSVEDHKGCKVVITTRRRQVCTSMGMGDRATSIIHVDVLTEQESWDLFKMQVSNIIESPTVKIVAKTIVKEVGGLPIALLTVGKALRDKDAEEWKEAAQELQRSNPTNIEEMEEKVFKCIKFSYDYLKDEEAKSCFLLCSLFPEDDRVPIESIVRYGVGLDIFKKAEKIQHVRRRVHSIIRNLKASSLLVASGSESWIKMHDIVRDFARKIMFDKYIGKAGEGLEEWPNEVTMDKYNGVGISVMRNKIQNYPDAWECSNLKILLMQNNHVEQEMPEVVFKGMKELRVLDQSCNFSYRSLEPFFGYLTNLCTLIIDWCYEIWNINALGELKMLEVLSLRDCTFREPLDVLRKLKNLRLLDLDGCTNCSSLFNYTTTRLEELHMTEYMSYEHHQFSFAKLTYFSHLSVLTLYVDEIRCIPENFVFPKLDHFAIAVGHVKYFYPDHNSLSLSGLVGTAKTLYDTRRNCFGQLLSSVNNLFIYDFDGLGSIVPHMVVAKDSLAVVKALAVERCNQFEYLINDEEESQILHGVIQHDQLTCFSDMENLILGDLNNFKGICCGKRLLHDMPWSFLKLERLRIDSCPRMSNIGVSFNLLQRMKQLHFLEINSCTTLEYLFDLQKEDVVVEEQVLGNLTELSLFRLPSLKHLWKGSTESLNLCSLQRVRITYCNKLRILFQWSVARSLVQLQDLSIADCDDLEGICAEKSSEEAVDGVMFPQLKKLWLFRLPILTSFYVGNTPLNGTPMLVDVRMGGTIMPLNDKNLNTLIEDNKELLLKSRRVPVTFISL